MANATTDPTLINKAVESLEAPDEVAVNTAAPTDTDVNLPGGFIARDGSVVKYAEVRELNGMDEEMIAKATNTGRALNTIFQRGLVSLGMDKVQKDDLDKVLAGDRDAILIGIRRATFGDFVDYTITCPGCEEKLDVKVDLGKDIKYKELDDPTTDRTFTYTSKKGKNILVKLPTTEVIKSLVEGTEKTVSELNTLLIAGCVVSIDGFPNIGNSAALSLGIADRDGIISEISKRNPGPRLGEVETTCGACGTSIPMPLSLADLFRL